jgi:hypothetical protein
LMPSLIKGQNTNAYTFVEGKPKLSQMARIRRPSTASPAGIFGIKKESVP